jgi:predicted permease
MRSADVVRLRLRSLFRRARVEAELAAELRFHLAQQIDEYIAAGMSPDEARHAALRAFGGVEQIQERCREMRGNRWIEQLFQDLQYAVRAFRRSPTFTLVAALSLALGIGANTAIFSLINAILLRELPVREPSQLVAVGDPARVSSLSTGNVRSDLMSAPMYRQIREQNHVFSQVFASGRVGRLSVGDSSLAEPESARGRLVSGNYFSVLGVQAIRGRTFNDEDDRAAGAAPYVVISHAYWQRRFALDPQIIGRRITLNKHPFTIIGVAPEGFFGDIVGLATDIWIPMSMQPQVNPGRDYLESWDASWLLLMGRLKPGVSIEKARAEINVLFPRIVKENATAITEDRLPGEDQARVEVGPGGAGFSSLRRQISQPLFTLMAMVALVLLVACANVANLMLERAMGRQKEIAVRLALGAGQGRLIRQLLTESVLLSIFGSLLGLLFAFWASKALLRLVSGVAATSVDLRPDLLVLGFTAVVAISTGILFGLAPAVRATKVELAPTLKESARSVAGQGAGGRWSFGKLLVVVQFALSLLLVMGAGLFLGTLRNLERLDLGYDRNSLLMVNVQPVAAGYESERLAMFPRDLIEQLKALPGVRAATFSENGIFSGTESSTTIRLPGAQGPAAAEFSIAYDCVGADYFRTIGIPLASGRDFELRDGPGAPNVAVINESMARKYFAGASPLGRHVVVSGEPERDYEIVGIARNARDHDLRGAVEPRLYVPFVQSGDVGADLNLEISTREPAAQIDPIRKAIVAYDANLPIHDMDPLSSMIDETITNERTIARLAVIFGLLALLLAAIGLYGVISYTIARRINEIGIRMALGARRSRVLWMVLRETLVLALVGIALGVPAALGSARAIASRLFGLSPFDLATLLTAIGILLVVAIFAGLIPGSRATRISPVQALRYE